MNTEAWTEHADSRGVYQFVTYERARFYLTKRRFGFRRWLLNGFVGRAYRHQFYWSEDAAKRGAREWML